MNDESADAADLLIVRQFEEPGAIAVRHNRASNCLPLFSDRRGDGQIRTCTFVTTFGNVASVLGGNPACPPSDSRSSGSSERPAHRQTMRNAQ